MRADAEAASRVAGLATRETGCCSFFHFDLSIGDGTVAMTVTTGDGHADVLAALGDRAEAMIGSTA